MAKEAPFKFIEYRGEDEHPHLTARVMPETLRAAQDLQDASGLSTATLLSRSYSLYAQGVMWWQDAQIPLVAVRDGARSEPLPLPRTHVEDRSALPRLETAVTEEYVTAVGHLALQEQRSEEDLVEDTLRYLGSAALLRQEGYTAIQPDSQRILPESVIELERLFTQ